VVLQESDLRFNAPRTRFPQNLGIGVRVKILPLKGCILKTKVDKTLKVEYQPCLANSHFVFQRIRLLPLGGSSMSTRKWLCRLFILAALGAVIGSTFAGCQSLGDESIGSDGHVGHQH
jgi:hypothetical protein